LAFNSGPLAQMRQSSQNSSTLQAAASGYEPHWPVKAQEKSPNQGPLLVSTMVAGGVGDDQGGVQLQQYQQMQGVAAVSAGALAAAAGNRVSQMDLRSGSSQVQDTVGPNSSSSGGRVGQGQGSLDTQASPSASSTNVYGPGPV
jgi:hypothetical protein